MGAGPERAGRLGRLGRYQTPSIAMVLLAYLYSASKRQTGSFLEKKKKNAAESLQT
jgi:hypothetical protein